MSRRLIELHLRRGRLLERIAHQRASLAREVPPVRAALSTADRLVAGVRAGVVFVKHHPSIVTLVVATLVVLKPGRIGRWTRRAYFAWKTWRTLRKTFPMFDVKAGS